MKDGKQSDALIMDFSKVFGKVGHKRLMEKLSYYGISGSTNRWIKSVLSNREQTVVIKGQKSYVASVTSGVPQGSVLGPCLFLLYINDLPEALSSRVRLFVDDTIAYLTVTSKRDVQELQKDLDKMGKWEEDWQMEFHLDKCKVLTVTRKKNPIKFINKISWSYPDKPA